MCTLSLSLENHLDIVAYRPIVKFSVESSLWSTSKEKRNKFRFSAKSFPETKIVDIRTKMMIYQLLETKHRNQIFVRLNHLAANRQNWRGISMATKYPVYSEYSNWGPSRFKLLETTYQSCDLVMMEKSSNSEQLCDCVEYIQYMYYRFGLILTTLTLNWWLIFQQGFVILLSTLDLMSKLKPTGWGV